MTYHPKHRAERHEDSCGEVCGTWRVDFVFCTDYLGRHRAEPS